MLEMVFPQRDSETSLSEDILGSEVLPVPSLMTFQSSDAAPSSVEETHLHKCLTIVSPEH